MWTRKDTSGAQGEYPGAVCHSPEVSPRCLLALFSPIDDCCPWCTPEGHRRPRPSGLPVRRRAPRLASSEIMTLLIHCHSRGDRDCKNYDTRPVPLPRHVACPGLSRCGYHVCLPDRWPGPRYRSPLHGRDPAGHRSSSAQCPPPGRGGEGRGGASSRIHRAVSPQPCTPRGMSEISRGSPPPAVPQEVPAPAAHGPGAAPSACPHQGPPRPAPAHRAGEAHPPSDSRALPVHLGSGWMVYSHPPRQPAWRLGCYLPETASCP